MLKRLPIGRLLIVSLAVAGCERRAGGSTTGAAIWPSPSAQALNAIPLGAPPGAVVNVAQSIHNPLEGQPQAIAQGKALFGSMNCVYCHASGGKGLMGPALDNAGWRYGGSPAEIYNSIHDGRPKGMPAWGARLPSDEIWKLVAYIESLGGATAPTSPPTINPVASRPSSTELQPTQGARPDRSNKAIVSDGIGHGR